MRRISVLGALAHAAIASMFSSALPTRGVHRTTADTRLGRQLNSPLYRPTFSRYDPHQGMQERLRRVIGGWANAPISKNAALGVGEARPGNAERQLEARGVLV